MIRVAFICQRFGDEIIGGAETHCKKLAHSLNQLDGYEVEVLTSCAKEYSLWQNFYPAGLEYLDGIAIHRFPVKMIRNWLVFGVYSKILYWYKKLFGRYQYLRSLEWQLEKIWYSLQGPYCPNLIKFIKTNENNYDVFIFFTYLYYPTVSGITQISNKPIFLVPTSHDEGPFYFLHTKLIFRKAVSIFANTSSEKKLIEKNNLEYKHLEILGANVSNDILSFEKSMAKIHLKCPYLIYVGRLDKGKNLEELFQYFLAFKESHPESPLKLILAGILAPNIAIPVSEHISYLGVLSEKSKHEWIAHSLCVVNSSLLESLSLIVLEAVSLKVPVLLHKNCNVFVEYLEGLETAYGYNCQKSFNKNILDLIQLKAKEKEFQLKLSKSKEWVVERFSEGVILSKLDRIIKKSL